jgi:RNA polymerase sigma-70 factor (ECF subfamily)
VPDRAPDPDALEARLAALLDAGALADTATLVVHGYGPGILGYLTALLREPDAAREAFAEFGLELWKGLPRFERRSSVKTWAYAIAYHCAQRSRRGDARRRTRPLTDSECSELVAAVRVTSEAFSPTEADRRLAVLRGTLSDAEQTLLVLRLDRRMEWRDIAVVLGEEGPAAPAALRKRFQRLKERLRETAIREGMIRGEKAR